MLILKGHKGPIYEIDFSPDGMKLVSAGRDGTARLWDLFKGKQIFLLKVGSCVNTVAFSADGRTVAAGGCEDKIVLWDSLHNKAIADLIIPLYGRSADWRGKRIESADFSASGKELIATANKGITCWTMKKSWNLAWDPPVMDGCVTCSPDGITFATGSTRTSDNSSNAIDIWAIETCEHIGRSVSRGPYATCRTTSLAYSPDGKLLAGTCGRELVVWDAWHRRNKPFIYKGNSTFFQSVAFSPDGLSLAAVNNDCSVRTWDTTTWTAGTTYDWEIGKLLDIAYAPDGMRAAACSNTGKIIIWDIV